jgi:hypothetical protein
MVAQLLMAVAACAADALGQPAAAAIAARVPAATVPASAATSESVEVRYCHAQWQLAEANLDRLQRMNRRVARTVPSSVVAEAQRDVDRARLRLQLAKAGKDRDEFAVWLRRARADFAKTETRWRKAVAVNRQAPKTFDSRDVERYRLRAEVDRLQYQRGQQLAAAPREAQLEWRVELLTNELDRVKEDAIRASPPARTRSYYYAFPVWW